MKQLEKTDLFNFEHENGKIRPYLPLFYQVFGQPVGNAPVVVVNHALTGNSNVCGENGWWNALVGEGKAIDTRQFTVVAFNIPGNGYDGDPANLVFNYTDFTIRDVARIFWQGLQFLGIRKVFSVIGGSLGGAIAWEMAALQPDKIQNLVPIATDWKATDWVIANVLIQEQILNNSDDPITDARLHAMLLYRTPGSVNRRFDRRRFEGSSVFEIEDWLIGHGIKLKNRFRLPAYKLMNHLLRTNDITRGRKDFPTVAASISANIHIVGVDSDYFFIPQENRESVSALKPSRENVQYHEITSIHGHDAFLIESAQLARILAPIFNKQKKHDHATA